MANEPARRIDVPGETYGTGNRKGVEIITHGQRRFRVHELEPIIQGELVSADPAATTKPGLFFRLSGTQQQFCVRFPSGAIQIIATEPA